MAAIEMDYSEAISPGFYIPSPSFRYSPHPGSSGRPSGAATPTTTLTPPSEPRSKNQTPAPRTNRVKRPHTKSRGGCFSCKSRRIKCQETKPSCANCIHKDLECVYPAKDRDQTLVVVDRSQIQLQGQSNSRSPPSGGSSPGLSLSSQLSTTPFTGDDLRFWHTFLVDARPHLPFGDEATWLCEIPSFAYECPHLLHSMLSLGASHCSLITPNGSQYAPVAIAHRGKALKALGAILAKGDECTVAEMDGALATCYTLTFQAHHMSDGVVDFAVMVRGCGLVTNWYFDRHIQSRIFNLKPAEDMWHLITSWLPAEPQQLNDPETIEACIASLDRLQPHLQSLAHHSFFDALRNGYQSLLISYRQAFLRIAMIYAAWSSLNNVDFLTFIAPGNHVSRALFMHYVTIDSFMRPVYLMIAQTRNLPFAGGHFLIYRWSEDVYNGLPEYLQELVVDQFQHVALDLIPEIEPHRTMWPQWNLELEGFIAWLKKRVSPEILAMYNIQ
ncbi:hypothetical protein BJY04DRAFT_197013 [Aspergillus karnatakaensis]|uniref:Zn(II)2Cys6 transcription factor domain-containing protein n=1 Tax=Aspergillus karnatakaensis TaxID=1810916 RepID=UPI003CCDD1FC